MWILVVYFHFRNDLIDPYLIYKQPQLLLLRNTWAFNNVQHVEKVRWVAVYVISFSLESLCLCHEGAEYLSERWYSCFLGPYFFHKYPYPKFLTWLFSYHVAHPYMLQIKNIFFLNFYSSHLVPQFLIYNNFSVPFLRAIIFSLKSNSIIDIWLLAHIPHTYFLLEHLKHIFHLLIATLFCLTSFYPI